MSRFRGELLAVLFLVGGLSLPGAQAPGGNSSTTSDPPSNPISTSIENASGRGEGDCTHLLAPVREAREYVGRDRQQFASAPGQGDTSPGSGAEAFPSDLRQDLIVLQQRQAALQRCVNRADPPENDPLAEAVCPAELLLNLRVSHRGESAGEVPILRVPGDSAFFYSAGMTIDADGAPNAYSPDNMGLDDLINAGAPGNWEGLAKGGDGEPFIQGADDPFPGYYVSQTALADRSRPVNDPRRYVDSVKIPFIVLPGWLARLLGARPGDFAIVLNQRTANYSAAIFGDMGPSDRIGEGSIALAENLEIRSNARYGGARRGIVYLVFPGSGNGSPRAVEEIQAESERLLQAWGSITRLLICASAPPSEVKGVTSTN